MKLHELAHGRTGDKGDTSNISIIAYEPADWTQLEREITVEKVAAHFGASFSKDITRYTLPQLHAMNFVFKGALTGGVTRSLVLDAHGKCLASVLLEMEI
ncbi:AtuA-related protein [Pseudogemmobacter sp. W21_MBD1_M6]|uniref:AtuA-related protein n=1 Tax=Pseudogemmobacter sp. W21_MBD1_M6 TaxID=3240271 RepID=UPI003F96E2D7